MGANRKLPTTTDVARLAGVSQSTVSSFSVGKRGITYRRLPGTGYSRPAVNWDIGEQAGQCVKQYRQRNHRHADR